MTITFDDGIDSFPYNHPTIPFLDGLFSASQSDNTISQEGALFLLDHVFTERSSQALDLIFKYDPSYIVFSLSKAIGLYVFGDKKQTYPPGYFSTQTRDKIKELRSEISDNDAIRMMPTLNNFEDFQTLGYDNSLHENFIKIKVLANSELHGVLLTRSWSIAVDVLDDDKKYSKNDLIKECKSSFCTLL